MNLKNDVLEIAKCAKCDSRIGKCRHENVGFFMQKVIQISTLIRELEKEKETQSHGYDTWGNEGHDAFDFIIKKLKEANK